MSTSVNIMIPAFEQVYAEFAECLVKVIQHNESRGIRTNVSFLAGSYISQARRELAHQFMDGKNEWAFWIDGDMKFPADAIERMISRDKNIIGCNYRRRRYPKTTFSAANGNLMNLIEVQTTDASPDVERADYLPGGMMLVHRSAYEALSWPYYAVQYNPRFNLEVGEDYFFCEKARGAGLELWIDHGVSRDVSHIGAFSYSCNLPFKS